MWFDPRTGARLLSPLRAERTGETGDRGRAWNHWVENPRWVEMRGGELLDLYLVEELIYQYLIVCR